MIEACYQISALYRQFDGELLVVQLQTGHFFYFTPNTKLIFDFFQEPQTLGAYLLASGLSDAGEEREYFERFFAQLVQCRIVEPAAASESLPLPKTTYSRPALLRIQEGKLADVALLCRISGPNSSESGT
jgi:hypothetical protein